MYFFTETWLSRFQDSESPTKNMQYIFEITEIAE